jgi:hypothetical protein
MIWHSGATLSAHLDDHTCCRVVQLDQVMQLVLTQNLDAGGGTV